MHKILIALPMLALLLCGCSSGPNTNPEWCSKATKYEKFPDGTEVAYYGANQRVEKYVNGDRETFNGTDVAGQKVSFLADGTRIQVNPDGTKQVRKKDGSEYYAAGGKLVKREQGTDRGKWQVEEFGVKTDVFPGECTRVKTYERYKWDRWDEVVTDAAGNRAEYTRYMAKDPTDTSGIRMRMFTWRLMIDRKDGTGSRTMYQDHDVPRSKEVFDGKGGCYAIYLLKDGSTIGHTNTRLPVSGANYVEIIEQFYTYEGDAEHVRIRREGPVQMSMKSGDQPKQERVDAFLREDGTVAFRQTWFQTAFRLSDGAYFPTLLGKLEVMNDRGEKVVQKITFNLGKLRHTPIITEVETIADDGTRLVSTYGDAQTCTKQTFFAADGKEQPVPADLNRIGHSAPALPRNQLDPCHGFGGVSTDMVVD